MTRAGVLAAWCLLMLFSSAGRRASATDFLIDNVDRQEPIVRLSPDVNDADQFGFAAVLHHLVAVDTDNDNRDEAAGKTRILVGAPRGDFPGGTDLTPVVNPTDPNKATQKFTGLVYQCPVSPGDCSAIGNGSLPVFDRTPNEFRPGTDEIKDAVLEDKSDQLMGQTLFSDGETFIACAPRWIRGTDTVRQPRGRCFFSGRDLSSFELLYPCNLTDRSNDAANTAADNYCSAGTGVTTINPVTQGYSISIGSPGKEFFAGSVFHVRNDEIIEGFNQNVSDLHQGFQVTTGYIRNAETTGMLDVLATVPRYDGITYAGRVNVIDLADIGNVAMTFDGDQIGAYFGHSIATADLSGNNFDDVIVGAPMYTDFASGLVENGRVHLFKNNAGTVNGISVTLDGRVAKGRFGFSVANLGDIDNDGREDFAVGAPYTPNPATSVPTACPSSYGSVFIYYGRDDFSTIGATMREIRASEIACMISPTISALNDLRSFGFSVSGGVDVDNNKFNDLVVGAQESKAVVVLRMLPVVDVVIELSTNVPEIILSNTSCNYFGSTYPCFTLTVTAMYFGRSAQGPLGNVPFLLTDTSVVLAQQRLFFPGTSAEDRMSSYSGLLNFPEVNTSVSQSVLVYALTDISVNSRLFNYTLGVSLQRISRPQTVATGNDPLSDLSPFPEIRTTGQTATEVRLNTDCGPDGICNANLQPGGLTVRFIAEDGSNMDKFIAGGTFFVEVDLDIENLSDEQGFEPILRFSLPAQFSTVTLPSSEGTCGLDSGTIFDCVFTRTTIPANEILRSARVQLAVDQSEVFGDTGTIALDFTVVLNNQLYNDSDTTNNQISTSFEVLADVDIAALALFNPDSATYGSQMTSTQRISVDFDVSIFNARFTTIRESVVDIFFPVTATERFLIISTYQFGTGVSCVTPDGNAVVSSSRRRRRAAPSNLRLKTVRTRELFRRQTTPPSGQVFNCTDETYRPNCLTIRCNISTLQRSVVKITISAEVNQSFIASKTPSEIYSLAGYAEVMIIDKQFQMENGTESNFATGSLRLMPETTPDPEDKSLLIHAIIWPIVGGVILFVLIVIGLYFCGFFRRKKPEEREGEVAVTEVAAPDTDKAAEVATDAGTTL